MKANNAGIRWFYLLLGILVIFFLGVIYAWSILKVPLTEEFGWTGSSLALNFTLTLCFFCLGNLAAGVLSRRVSVRVLLLGSAVLSGAGFCLVSSMGGNIVQLYLFYGVMGGFGIGIGYNAIIATLNGWFTDMRGLCSGALMMSFGISTLVLGRAAEALIRTEALGWRGTFLILGIVLAAVTLICAVFLRTVPATEGGRTAAAAVARREYTPLEMLKTGPFWFYFVNQLLNAAIGGAVISIAKELSLSVGASDSLATTLVGVLSICNGVGRISCGLLHDSLKYNKTLFLSGLLTLTAPLALLSSVLLHSLPLAAAGLILTGLAYGTCPTLVSTTASGFFGMKHYSTNYSIANMIVVPASFSATVASGLLASTGSYTAPFLMLSGFGVCSFALQFLVRPPEA